MLNCPLPNRTEESDMKPTLVDIFCGAGLMSGGFKKAGFKPIYAIDANRFAVASYNNNVAKVAECGFVEEPPRELKSDILIAGPPCQGFSTLGLRNPLDPRNNMGLRVIDWARSLECELVVVENVKQFINSSNWSALVAGMEDIGFKSTLWALDAASYNTPQYRERCFTIFSKSRLYGLPAPMKKELNCQKVFDKPIRKNDPLHVWPSPSKLALERIKLVPPGGDKLDIMDKAPEICPQSWFRLGRQALGVWGRIDRSKPSSTIRCDFQNPSKGRHIHPEKNRVISLREGARIQGVPDSWNFVGSRSQISRQIGNGVPLPLAEAVAKTLAA